MQATCIEVHVADAAELHAHGAGERFDRVLVDPPCSGLGTLQSRPDLRWHAGERSIPELAALQSRILDAAAAATRPGGTLGYSVCTISKAEGADVVEGFLARNPEFTVAPSHAASPFSAPDPWTGNHLQLLPSRDGTDGFFIARLRRRG
jgi:16S rRNA (cytosine967-C5)-methyltransferase